MKLPGDIEGNTILDPDPSEAAQVSTHLGRRSTGHRFQPVLEISARKAARGRRLPRAVILDPGVPVDRPFPLNVRRATPSELEALAPLVAIAFTASGVRR